MSKIQKFFFNLNKIPLYLLIFLFPLWFLPLGEDEVNLSKQILATFLVSISLVGFFGRKIFERDLSFKTHKVFWIFLGLFFPSIFSFFNFPYFWTSFFGNPKEIGDSIFSLILYFLATFLYFQSFEKKEIPLLLFWFLFSSGIVLILALLSQFKIYLLPFDFAKTPFFTLVGILPQFCVFLALFLPLFYLFSVKTKSFFRLFFFLFFFVALFDLFLAGSRLAWFLVGIESLFLFLLTFKPNFQNYGVSFGYLILFSLSLFFYFFPLFQKEILTFDTLPYSFETLFARQIFSFPWRQKILGTGPASFLFTFAKFKPAILNQTIFWPTRFSRGASFFLDWFVTRGIFGAVLFLVSFFFLFQFLLKKIFSGTFSEKNFLETKTLGTILFSFSLCFFIFNPNFSLQFLFFSFLGLFLLFAEPKIKIFYQAPLSHFGFNLLFLISFL
ncbi:hypothetical protein H5T58_01255, partial [Candidatus Parcubacteria bacterium]|nr:hypothetical protein [Candidatus Parcubacteria bacterium]